LPRGRSRAIVIQKGRIFADVDPREIFHDAKLKEEGGLESINAHLHYHVHDYGWPGISYPRL
jgi:hypothetical protein